MTQEPLTLRFETVMHLLKQLKNYNFLVWFLKILQQYFIIFQDNEKVLILQHKCQQYGKTKLFTFNKIWLWWHFNALKIDNHDQNQSIKPLKFIQIWNLPNRLSILLTIFKNLRRLSVASLTYKGLPWKFQNKINFFFFFFKSKL